MGRFFAVADWAAIPQIWDARIPHEHGAASTFAPI
jgi:hypothetical protein